MGIKSPLVRATRYLERFDPAIDKDYDLMRQVAQSVACENRDLKARFESRVGACRL